MEYFGRIKNQYLTPKRYYHTFEGHIVQGLEVFEEVKDVSDNPDLVYFSWMNHDVIYDPRLEDNEEQSGVFAYHLAIEMGLGYDFSKMSNGLVLITKHVKKPETTDEKIIVDMDLSVFGQPEEIFDEYESRIVKEYEWVPEEIFKRERTKILQRFLERKQIYHTSEIRNKYEEKARRNLKRSLKRLVFS